MKAREPCADLY